MSFSRHEEIYPPDVRSETGSRLGRLLPALIGTDESPAGYSLAGCAPAEPTSASPARLRMRYSSPAGRDFRSDRQIGS